MSSAAAAGHELAERALRLVQDVPDFPLPGVLFKDIMPLLADGPTFAAVVDHIVATHTGFDVVVGIEARGFLLAAPIAYAAGCGVVSVRKVGKLPGPLLSTSYQLEYGEGTLELHRAALHTGLRVLLVDDVLATGGSIAAAADLIASAGAVLAGVAVLIELIDLGGRQRLPMDVTALLSV